MHFSGGARRYIPKEGDWYCPNPNCKNINFSRRFKCNRCGCPRPQSSFDDQKRGFRDNFRYNNKEGNYRENFFKNRNYYDHSRSRSRNKSRSRNSRDKNRSGSKGDLGENRSKDWKFDKPREGGYDQRNLPNKRFNGPPGLFKEGDWKCEFCENINFSWRGECNKCHHPKTGGFQQGPMDNNMQSGNFRRFENRDFYYNKRQPYLGKPFNFRNNQYPPNTGMKLYSGKGFNSYNDFNDYKGRDNKFGKPSRGLNSRDFHIKDRMDKRTSHHYHKRRNSSNSSSKRSSSSSSYSRHKHGRKSSSDNESKSGDSRSKSDESSSRKSKSESDSDVSRSRSGSGYSSHSNSESSSKKEGGETGAKVEKKAGEE